MKILLHACCGPCSLEPVRIYQEEEASFSIFYYNPNIHPQEEYEHRLKTIKEHVAGPQAIKLYEGDYDLAAWKETAGTHGEDRTNRCRACYRMRFEKLAQVAKDEGYDAIGTTLTISPYQYTDVILDELQRAASLYGLETDARDYRECYPEATRRSRAMGMYRQNYCGCAFSVAEAQRDREQRAKAREKEKRMKQAALLQAAAEGVVNQISQL